MDGTITPCVTKLNGYVILMSFLFKHWVFSAAGFWGGRGGGGLEDGRMEYGQGGSHK